MKTREELLDMMQADKVFFDDGSYRSICRIDVVDLLSAPTQEQLDCPYCRNMNLEDYHKMLEENRTDDSNYIAKVKYCEVCGRKLGDE